MKGFTKFTLPDPKWGNPKIALPIVKGEDPWGIAVPLRQNPSVPFSLPVVPEALVEAGKLGRSDELLRSLGRPPRGCLRYFQGISAQCKNASSCPMVGPKCHPHQDMPECWEFNDADVSVSEVVTAIAKLWREGYYVGVAESK